VSKSWLIPLGLVDDVIAAPIVLGGLAASCFPAKDETGSRAGTKVSQIALIGLLLFVVSPVSLHLNRIVCWEAVFMLIAISRPLLGERQTPIDRPGKIFCCYMVASALLSLFAGHSWKGVLAELTPALEMFLCFRLGACLELNDGTKQRWMRWILIMVSLRSAWQIVAVILGINIIPPIYDAEHELKAVVSIGGFDFERLIDPIAGLFVPISATFLLFDMQDRWAKVALAACLAVCILGFTRSEWIGSALCVILLAWHSGRSRKLIKWASLSAASLTLLISLTPNLCEAVSTRLVDYTAQQMFDPHDELQQLRFLELGTALKAFESAPGFGIGLGSGLDTPVLTDEGWVFVIIHNSFANMLASIGLVGVGLMLYVVWKAWRVFARSYRNKNAFVLAGFLALIWYGTFMAFQPIYSVYHLPVIVGFLYGMGLSGGARPIGEMHPAAFAGPES